MIRPVFKLFFPLACCLGLNACSSLFGQEGYFRDRGDDYLKADTLPPVEVPMGMNKGTMDQLYVIPKIGRAEDDLPQVFEVPRPQPLAANQLTEKVKIQRLGEKRWILINTPPSETWPRVRNFLSRNNLQVAYTDATNGIIETNWLQFKTDPEKRDRYRLRIEQGVQPESTEIHVLHLSVNQAATKKQVEWPSQSSDQERESWMVDELASTLASDVTSTGTSLLAQTIGGGAKVALLNSQTEPLLHMDLEYQRAWATLAYAVQREGFTLWDEDRSAGVFYVDFKKPPEEDEEPGFLSRWFSGDEDKTPPGSPYSLQEILAHLQLEDTPENRQVFASIIDNHTPGAPLEDAPGYLVFVRGLDNGIEVRIRDASARVLKAKEARQLLKVIRRNLI